MKTALMALLLATMPIPAAAETLVGQASVIDGDTLEIHGERIRMLGIDAPESRQVCINADGVKYRCGKDAAFALSDRIGHATVECRGDERDRYKRLIAICSVGNIDLSAWMVEEGYAVAYRRYSQAYAAQEEEAKAANRRLWAGQFQMPWDWRKH
jgi:endonuclease YncB( thermonuclease family)